MTLDVADVHPTGKAFHHLDEVVHAQSEPTASGIPATDRAPSTTQLRTETAETLS